MYENKNYWDHSFDNAGTGNGQRNFGTNASNTASQGWQAPDYDRDFGNSEQVNTAPNFTAEQANTGNGAGAYPPERRMMEVYHAKPVGFPQQPASHKKERIKSGMTKKAAAMILTLAVVLSGAAGAGSVLLTNQLLSAESTQSGGSTVSTTPVNTSSSANSAYSVEAVAEIAADSVVEITTESVSTDRWMQQVVSEGAGSGVILSQDGKIVTNNHVIEGASTITVRLRSGETYPATLIGTDSETDVALLKIDATGLTPATLGDSDTLKVGEPAIAIGNPLGQLGGTVTDGIISALNRDITLDGETMNLLQTNAAINPGNSGGGLFNAQGQLIGIVVAKSSGTGVEGLGFAIPINQVKSVVAELETNGYVTGRAAMGVSLVDIQDAQTAMAYRVDRAGVYVLAVNDGSAAQKAGIQAGDCIVSVDGTEISDAASLTELIESHSVGDTISVSVLRNGQTLTLSVTLGEQTASSN